MCGIAGVVGPRVAWADAFVDRAVELQHHRGPDGRGTWRRDPSAGGPDVAFGHNRLAVVDLSHGGAQPMHHGERGLVLVYNGEIYNHLELREQLRAAGHRFRSSSDTEVLLAAYAEWGEACLDRLVGMFAFAVWDEPRRHLVLARDRLGEKPLHYVWIPESATLAFASEVKPLLGLPGVVYSLDETVLARYATGGSLATGPDCMVAPVRRLPPATWAVVGADPGPPAPRSYWQPPTDELGLSPDEAARAVRERLRGSVDERLHADVAVGSSLSGGIDSSAIVCLIAASGEAHEQHTFTARMSEPALDEGDHVAAVVDATGVHNHQVWPDPSRFTDDFDRWIRHLEEPVPTTSPYAQWCVMRLAAEEGVVVLLDGQGADELFAGYLPYHHTRLRELWSGRHVVELGREVRAGRPSGSGQAFSWRAATAHTFPRAYRAYTRRRAAGRPEPAGPWHADWLDAHPLTPPDRSSLRSALAHDLVGGPLQELLRYCDRNSMAWSREVRLPFLDHELVALAHALPPGLKIRNGLRKAVLRDALAGIVPRSVVDRTDKLGFQAPLGTWFGGPLAAWLDQRVEAARPVLGDRLAPPPGPGPSVHDRFTAAVTGASVALLLDPAWRLEAL